MGKQKRLQAFHNDATVKKKYVDRLKLHYKQDEIVRGTYWENGKGCAIGCTIHSADHERYESEMGIPSWLAHLEDQLFEGMGNGKAKDFPLQLMTVIPVGMTEERFNIVKHKFLAYCLEDVRKNVSNRVVQNAIQNVINLHRKAANKSIKMSKWEAVRAARAARAAGEARAARAAERAAGAARAARAAVEAKAVRSVRAAAVAARAERAARAAEDAARAARAAGAAEDAVRAAVDAAGAAGAAERAAGGVAANNKMAKKLLEIIKEAQN